jgi:cytochrome c
MENVMRRVLVSGLAVLAGAVFSGSILAQSPNRQQGQRVFGACAACHSLEPNRNMTGPSLANLWNRQAGSLQSFDRYSPAVKSSGIIWDDKSLDAWLKDPQEFIPDNHMTFRGVKDARQRADLLAFLNDATRPGASIVQSPQQGGMRGMMGSGRVPNLKKLDAEDRVQSIRHCRDTYRVTTGDGKTRDFWERNLRFKTDSSADGPEKNAPAIVDAGMMGDRASVIFATPEEISGFIARGC